MATLQLVTETAPPISSYVIQFYVRLYKCKTQDMIPSHNDLYLESGSRPVVITQSFVDSIIGVLPPMPRPPIFLRVPLYQIPIVQRPPSPDFVIIDIQPQN
jgi:hypothetical protein